MLLTMFLTACLTGGSGGGETPLRINFTNLGDADSIITPDFIVNINGTVESAAEVETVEWTNDRGGSGKANGKEQWATGNIVLKVGVNNITVTANDVDGNANSKSVAIERENPNSPGFAESNSPVVVYSYNKDMSNAAPVENASLETKVVYFRLDPGENWTARGIQQVDFSCCKGVEGAGSGDAYDVTSSVVTSPWTTSIDLTTMQPGGTRRFRAITSFKNGAEAESHTADFELVATGTRSNSPPTISGSPPRNATSGVGYAFSPVGKDADGDTLSFSINGKPGWAKFNTSTGKLSGTPAAIDAGVYQDIIITVSDGKASTNLPKFSITVAAGANGSATISWNPPTERVDNTAVTNLAGYTIHYGQSPNSYSNSREIDSPGITTYMVDNLSPGTWYFAVTAFDSNGIKSGFSAQGQKDIL